MISPSKYVAAQAVDDEYPSGEHSALANLRTAARGGLIEAMRDVGGLIWRNPALSDNGLQDAVYWLDKAASGGSLQAQKTLAMNYAIEHEIRDVSLSNSYYAMAARAGDPNAQYYYARNILATENLSDRQNGLSWMMQSAAGGDSDAQDYLLKLAPSSIGNDFLPQRLRTISGCKEWIKAAERELTTRREAWGEYVMRSSPDISQ